MTALDTRYLPKAKAKIAKYGIAATWTTDTGLSISASTGLPVESAPDTHAVTVTPPQSTAKLDAPQRGESGTTVVYLAGQGLPFEPGLGHRMTFHSQTWRVVGLSAFRPGDEVAVWEVRLAGAGVA